MPSTPRQIELMQALGATPPAYAHLPLIVGPDGQKLSKRFHAVAVERFREDGILPEALVNYLALLGWSRDATTTFMTREEMIEAFDIAHVSRNPAVFDLQKLAWMNGHYIRETPDDRLAGMIEESLREQGVEADAATVGRALPLIKERHADDRRGGADAAVPVRGRGARREGARHARSGPRRAAAGGDRTALRRPGGVEGRRHPRRR